MSWARKATAEVDETDGLLQLHQLSLRLVSAPDLATALEEVLDASIELSGAAKGNVQLRDATTGHLAIAAQRGFDRAFLERFHTVTDDDGTACGRAMQTGKQVVIDDVERDPTFAPYAATAIEAGYRAVQSTPLTSSGGELLGVISTHFIEPYRPTRSELQLLHLYARLAADLVARIRAEEALRQSEEKYRSLFENIDAGFALCELIRDEHGRPLDFRHLEANPAYAEMTGIPVERAMGRTARELLPNLERAWPEHHGKVIDTGEPARIVHYSEDLGRWLEVSSFPRGGDQFAVLFKDITKRTRAEHELAESSRRKDEFLAVLSHELRNPLAPIRSSVYVLRQAEPGSDRAARAVSVIDRQTQQMTHLIDDLLDIVRIARGKIQLQRASVELNELVRHTAEDHRDLFAEHGVQLSVDTAGQPLHVLGDPIRLSQIVGNLLSNSAKFTPEGGETLLSVERENAQLARIRVADTGPGLTPETRAHLFEPFAQGDRTLARSNGGLGLGLALVRGLVEMHGGTVEATEAVAARGAEFVVTLPLQPSATRSRPREPTPLQRGTARRVLVIEDNDDAAEALREALELGNHEVELAHSGPEGIDKAHQFRPEVVLCDIGLPDMDGYAVARTLRADPELGSVYLVALSGYAHTEDINRCTDAGFSRHVAKPPDLDLLEALLAEVPASPEAD